MRAVPLILLAIWLTMGLFVRDWYGCNNQVEIAEVVPATEGTIIKAIPTERVERQELSIVDGNLFSVVADDNLRFGFSSYEHSQPRARSVTSALTKAADYLKSNPGKALTLTGLHRADERNDSALPNLGMARANNLKKVLNGLGVSSEQILIAGAEVRNINLIQDMLIGPIRFNFTDLGITDDKLISIETRLRKAPMKIYFQTNEEGIVMNNELRDYFADLLYYLDHKPRAKVESTGHTDNRGLRATNIALGQGRAEFIRDYLAQQGANSKQIITRSVGPDKPIATNSTASGRSLNRRVEITIK